MELSSLTRIVSFILFPLQNLDFDPAVVEIGAPDFERWHHALFGLRGQNGIAEDAGSEASEIDETQVNELPEEEDTSEIPV